MKNILFLILVIFLSAKSFSQHSNWISYNNNKDINCIFNDGNFLWIGTTGGLVKFDKSNQSSIYFTRDNTLLPSPNIIDIEKDAAGNMWVVMGEGGIAKYNGVSWTVISTANSQLSDNFVQDICFDKNGKLWIAAWRGVDCYFNNTWTHYNNAFLWNVKTIAADTLGNIYGATDGYGMVKFNGTTWTNFSTLNSTILSSRIYDLKIDSQNNVWMSSIVCGNGNPGLCKYNAGIFTNCITNQNLQEMYIDDADNLWIIGYPFNVIYKYDGFNLTNYSTGNSPSNMTNDVVIYDGTDIWFNVFRDGLRKLDTNSVVTPVNISSCNLRNNYFGEVAADTNGNIWINHWTGLDKFDGSTFTYFDSASSGWPVNNIGTFSIDPFNNFWFSTQFDGIYKYNGSTWQHFDSATYNFPSGRLAQSPMFDNAGNAYFLFAFNYNSQNQKTGGGFYKFNGSTLQKITFTSISDTSINRIFPDKAGRFWASDFNVIEIVDGGTHTVLTSSVLPIISGSIPQIMASDNFNNCYLVTDAISGNYYKVSPSFQSTSYNPTNCASGPFGDWITAMFADNNNNLWIKIETTCSYNSDYVAAKYDGSTFQIFGMNNSGLINSYINLMLVYGNKIYFGGHGGLSIYTDSSITVTVKANENMNALFPELYPNPTSSTITLSSLNPTTNYSISIKDILGNTIIAQKHKGSERMSVNVKSLASGIYFIVAESNGASAVKKFVKQ